MTGPFRVPASAGEKFGTWIDRSEPVGFRLGSAVHNGFYGDTLTSALLAAGVASFGVSPVLGRPRGPMALDVDDASLLLVQQEGGAWRASRPGDVFPREGLRARPVEVAFGPAALRRMGPRVGPDERSLPIVRQGIELLRRSLPMPAPRLPQPSPPPAARREACDALVVGAGLAGLAAATALRSAGLTVRIVEAGARAGGVADLYEGRIEGKPLSVWAEARAAALADVGALSLRATAVAIEPDGAVTVLGPSGRDGAMEVRLISAGAVVLATGFRERPLAFSDNDRPGIVFAGAARALLRRHAVAPGARVLVATACDEGYRTAMDLREAGVAVDFVIDRRDDPGGPAVEMAKALGAPVSLSSVVTGVETDAKTGAITGVRTRNRYGEGASSGVRVLPADALVVSGGFAPRDELARGCGLGPEQGLHVAIASPNAMDAVAAGWAAGVAAAAQLGATVDKAAPTVEASADEFDEPAGFAAETFAAVGSNAVFVDIGADIALADIARAVERRGPAQAAIERRLGLGRGPDGGRLSADLPATALRALDVEAGDFAVPSPGGLTLAQLAARGALKRR